MARGLVSKKRDGFSGVIAEKKSRCAALPSCVASQGRADVDEFLQAGHPPGGAGLRAIQKHLLNTRDGRT
jgi:hypothetical protein